MLEAEGNSSNEKEELSTGEGPLKVKEQPGKIGYSSKTCPIAMPKRNEMAWICSFESMR